MSVGPPEIAPACPQANLCLSSPMATENTLPCGLDSDHLPALQLAETLCSKAVAGALEFEKEWAKADGQLTDPLHYYRVGSLMLDLSLSPGVTAAASKRFLETGFSHLEQAAEANDNPRVKNETEFIVASKPLFVARQLAAVNHSDSSYNGPTELAHLDTEQFNELHMNTLNLASQILEANVRDPEQVAKIGTQLLCFREGRLAFPATARESLAISVEGHIDPWLHHSLYAIDNTGKIPYRPGTGINGVHLEHVVAVSFNNMSTRAIGAAYEKFPGGRKDFGALILTWLRNEARGEQLNSQEQHALHAISRRLYEKETKLPARNYK